MFVVHRMITKFLFLAYLKEFESLKHFCARLKTFIELKTKKLKSEIFIAIVYRAELHALTNY